MDEELQKKIKKLTRCRTIARTERIAWTDEQFCELLGVGNVAAYKRAISGQTKKIDKWLDAAVKLLSDNDIYADENDIILRKLSHIEHRLERIEQILKDYLPITLIDNEVKV